MAGSPCALSVLANFPRRAQPVMLAESLKISWQIRARLPLRILIPKGQLGGKNFSKVRVSGGFLLQNFIGYSVQFAQ